MLQDFNNSGFVKVKLSLSSEKSDAMIVKTTEKINLGNTLSKAH